MSAELDVVKYAEDFYTAFGQGYGEATISREDADGVAFAAIQGLYDLVQEQAALLAALQAGALDLRLSPTRVRAISPPWLRERR